MKKLKVGEFFSGYGSQSLGLKYLGINHEVVCTSEIDINAILTYGVIRYNIDKQNNFSMEYMKKYLKDKNIGIDIKTNKNKKIDKLDDKTLNRLFNATVMSNNLGDISIIDTRDIPDMDLMTYSFPCQSISRAGKMEGAKEGSGTKSSLLYECKKIISNKKIKYLIMENVSDLLCKKHIDTFMDWCGWLERQGYTNSYKLMKGSDYGVPQNRTRIFMVSILNGDKFEFEEPVKTIKSISDYLEMDIKSYNYYDLINRNENELNISKACLDIIDIVGNKIRIKQATKKGYIELIPVGVCDLSYPKSKLRRGRVQNGGRFCPTLTATQQNLYIIDKNYNIRKFTNREEFRLMGVKDDDIDNIFKLNLSCAEYHKLAGNSIIIDILKVIYNKLFKNYINEV